MKFPVLIIGFNRPEKLKRVIEKVIDEQREIYVALDGPRKFNQRDEIKVEQCIEIVKKFQKTKKIFTLYQKQNLGCKIGEQRAMNWFFDNNEAGIILEDDVIIENEFLNFCDENLVKYRNDDKIWSICGFIPFEIRSLNLDNSKKEFYTCDTPQTWGWASWKRVWQKYQSEITINDLQNIKYPEIFYEKKYKINKKIWERRFLDLIHGRVSTWDYQFTLSCWNNSGINIFPRRNYVLNIGFDSEATHTLTESSKNTEIVEIENLDFSSQFHEIDKLNYLEFNFIIKYISLRIQDLYLRLKIAKR
jgi:GR25 family glycosyltransferase involved in LPS biosynthesis